jgi:ABC-type nitrate/sulfonate/bicarbonate transport system substrate-binding protein
LPESPKRLRDDITQKLRISATFILSAFGFNNSENWEETMTTRRAVLRSGFCSLAAIAVGARVDAHADPALQPVNIVIPQSSVFVLNYMGAKDAGVFAKDGIDLAIDPRPFAGFLAGLPSKQCMAATYSGMDAIEKINEGVDWVIIGGGLTVVQDVIVRKDAPYKSPGDLRGKKFGVFSTGAGSFKAARAAMIDADHIDVVKDANLQQVAGPALTKLLERGDVDAMINISSLNIAAEAQPDKFRVLFSPNDYWKQKTGFPIVWAAPLVAWRSWVDEDRTRAQKYAAAVADSFRWLENPQNLQTAVKNHGTLAGVTTPQDVAEYKDWLTHKNMFMTEWDQKSVDAQWQFLQLAQRTGILTKVPDEKKYALFVQS